MAKARVNGIEIDYQDTGRGRPILLTHGHMCSTAFTILLITPWYPFCSLPSSKLLAGQNARPTLLKLISVASRIRHHPIGFLYVINP